MHMGMWLIAEVCVARMEQEGRRFTLDGEPVEIGEFISANADQFNDLDALNAVLDLEPEAPGILYGGGAFATRELKRIA